MSTRRSGFIRVQRTDGRIGFIDGGAVHYVFEDTDTVGAKGEEKQTIPCLGIAMANNVTLKIVGETEATLLQKLATAAGQDKIHLI